MDEIVDDRIETALKRFKYCSEAELSNREQALEAIRFRKLEQWPESIRVSRETDPHGARPCLVLDKLNQYVRNVCNEQRQNRPSIKTRPFDDLADPKTSEIFTGIIRHIEYNSRADIAYDTAFEHAVDGGFGYWRILTEYAGQDSFDQDIIISRIRNRFSVYIDPSHQDPTGCDMRYAFVTDKISRDEYKKKYGEQVDWETGAGDHQVGWWGEDFVRVAEYFYYDYKKEKILLLENGAVIPANIYEKDIPQIYRNGIKIPVVRERDTERKQIKWCKLSAFDVLDERDVLGEWIPIIKVQGYEIDDEGKLVLFGMIKGGADPQKMYNYAASAFTEMVSLAPKAPFIAAEGQIEGHEDEWQAANRENIAVLKYKVTDLNGTLVPPPQRQQMPGIPSGWDRAMQNFEHDIQTSTGMYADSLGQQTNATSGIAIGQRVDQSQTSVFNFTDNLVRSMQHTGRILVDLIPKIYDTQRVARILGDDNKSEVVQIDPDQTESRKEINTANGIKTIYNLDVGKYDVYVTVGPAYASRRAEASAAMMTVMQTNPELMNVTGDLVFKAQDWPGADEFAERMKKLLPPNLQDKDDDGSEETIDTPEGPLPVSQAGQAISMLTDQVKGMTNAIEQAKVQQTENETIKLKIESEKAKTDRMKAETEWKKVQAEIELKQKEALSNFEIEKAELERLKKELALEGKLLKEQLAREEQDAIHKVEKSLTSVKEHETEKHEKEESSKNSEESTSALLESNRILTESVKEMLSTLSAPRVTELQLDQHGNPVGAVSRIA